MTPLTALLLTAAVAAPAKDNKPATAAQAPMSAEAFSRAAFRTTGPSVMAGRTVDIAVSPRPVTCVLAAASGGVWRTTVWGITFTPVFDSQPSFSIGCVTVDPKDPLTVLVG